MGGPAGEMASHGPGGRSRALGPVPGASAHLTAVPQAMPMAPARRSTACLAHPHSWEWAAYGLQGPLLLLCLPQAGGPAGEGPGVQGVGGPRVTKGSLLGARVDGRGCWGRSTAFPSPGRGVLDLGEDACPVPCTNGVALNQKRAPGESLARSSSGWRLTGPSLPARPPESCLRHLSLREDGGLHPARPGAPDLQAAPCPSDPGAGAGANQRAGHSGALGHEAAGAVHQHHHLPGSG